MGESKREKRNERKVEGMFRANKGKGVRKKKKNSCDRLATKGYKRKKKRDGRIALAKGRERVASEQCRKEWRRMVVKKRKRKRRLGGRRGGQKEEEEEVGGVDSKRNGEGVSRIGWTGRKSEQCGDPEL